MCSRDSFQFIARFHGLTKANVPPYKAFFLNQNCQKFFVCFGKYFSLFFNAFPHKVLHGFNGGRKFIRMNVSDDPGGRLRPVKSELIGAFDGEWVAPFIPARPDGRTRFYTCNHRPSRTTRLPVRNWPELDGFCWPPCFQVCKSIEIIGPITLCVLDAVVSL